MSIFDKFRGKSNPSLEERFKEIRQDLVKRGKEQSWQYKINPKDEAEKIGTSCGILKDGFLEKKHHPGYFVDIALGLLCYPPEVGFIITTQFTDYESRLGFNPFGTIMVALGQIDSLYRGVLVRKSVFDEKPQLFEVINNKGVRIKKAAELLAAGIVISSENIKRAREIYHNNKFDPSVKVALDEQLNKYGQDLAKQIIS
ncbi:MAG: hypothetical protein QW404_02845 [Candidatus Nanoarchaeia archaeon]